MTGRRYNKPGLHGSAIGIRLWVVINARYSIAYNSLVNIRTNFRGEKIRE